MNQIKTAYLGLVYKLVFVHRAATLSNRSQKVQPIPGNESTLSCKLSVETCNAVVVVSKSLFRSRSDRHFYGTENGIWAGLASVGDTDFCFQSQKNNLKISKNIVVSTLKSCIK